MSTLNKEADLVFVLNFNHQRNAVAECPTATCCVALRGTKACEDVIVS